MSTRFRILCCRCSTPTLYVVCCHHPRSTVCCNYRHSLRMTTDTCEMQYLLDACTTIVCSMFSNPTYATLPERGKSFDATELRLLSCLCECQCLCAVYTSGHPILMVMVMVRANCACILPTYLVQQERIRTSYRSTPAYTLFCCTCSSFLNLEALRAVIGSYGEKNVISPVSPSPPPALCIINLLGLVEKRKLLLHFTAGGLVSVLWRRRLESMEGMELGCRSMNERAATPLLLWTALPDRRK